MTRIGEKFEQLKEKKRMAFMPFFVAGDPDLKTSMEIGRALASRADILEIGFPYSDPIADGPTIQAADTRAIASGMNTNRVFALIRAIRNVSPTPISILVYANLVQQRGIARFYRDTRDAGVDGVLIPDVPIEEASPFLHMAKSVGIDQIFIVAPTTNPARLEKIIRRAQGYLYVVSVLGVTGTRTILSPEIPRLIKKIKVHTSLPLAIGFGISKKEHLVALKEAGADGAIVGSALVNIIQENTDDKKNIPKKLIAYLENHFIL